jgi:hypothetical protein
MLPKVAWYFWCVRLGVSISTADCCLYVFAGYVDFMFASFTRLFVDVLHCLVSLRAPSKNIKLKVIRNVILAVILCGHEPCSVTLNEEHRLMIFEKRVLRKATGFKREERQGNGKTCSSESFIGVGLLLWNMMAVVKRRGYEGWTCDTRANRRAGNRV